MNTTKNHHAAIFTTPHRLHFLITTRCTYDAFSDATYKPYLTEGTVPLEMASFELEWRDLNGRKIPVGEHTGEDGTILWHDEFSTVTDATRALLERLRSIATQVDEHVNVLATAVAAAATHSLNTTAPDAPVADADVKKCSPRVAPPTAVEEDDERRDAQSLLASIGRELTLLNRILRKRFAARRRVELAAVLASPNGLAFSWMHLNRKARDAIGAAARRISGSDLAPCCRDPRDALAFVRELNKQLALDDGRFGSGENHVLGEEQTISR